MGAVGRVPTGGNDGSEVRRVKVVGAVVVIVLSGPVALAAVTGAAGAGGRFESPSEHATAEIPPDLLGVYMAASLTCDGLPWPVLAAVGWVESRHADGRADPLSGAVQPPIVGPALNGRAGPGAIPGQSVRALGPMQFLPATWARWGVVAPDRPPGAQPDPHNAWDAIHSAANYLCSGQDRLGDLRAALRRYNRSNVYVDEVLAKAAEYGDASPALVGGETRSGSAAAVIAAAMTQLGVPYRWGAETPGVGFDCSGLVQWAFAEAGVRLPRTTSQQITSGVAVPSVRELRPGDLVFTRSVRGGRVVGVGHVAIYVGDGRVIVAPRTGDIVRVRPIGADVEAIRRVLEPA